MVDTHAHLEMCEPQTGELVELAREAGVGRILAIGMTEGSNLEAIAAAEEHEEVYSCVGCHPNEAAGFDDEAARSIEALATTHASVRAIGETGLDYHRDRAPREDQRRAFLAQIEIARRTELPLVVHLRESAEDSFELLASEADGIPVVIHCFSPAERVTEAIARGWYCSFAGNVTYPNALDLQAAAREVPDELLLVETDCPYLSPQIVRGQPNQPAHVAATAEFLAGLRGVSYEQLEATVDANAARLFRW